MCFTPVPVIILDVLNNSITEYDSYSHASRELEIEVKTIREATLKNHGWYRDKRIFKKENFLRDLKTNVHKCWGMKNIVTGATKAFTNLDDMARAVGTSVPNLKHVLEDPRQPLYFGEVLLRPLDGYTTWRKTKPLEEELFGGAENPVVRINIHTGNKTIFCNLRQLARIDKLSYWRLRTMNSKGIKEFTQCGYRYVFVESTYKKEKSHEPLSS